MNQLCRRRRGALAPPRSCQAGSIERRGCYLWLNFGRPCWTLGTGGEVLQRRDYSIDLRYCRGGSPVSKALSNGHSRRSRAELTPIASVHSATRANIRNRRTTAWLAVVCCLGATLSPAYNGVFGHYLANSRNCSTYLV
jgi:hypothetical protein